MDKRICPYLGIRRPDGSQGEAQDYPSFENSCFAIPPGSPEGQEPLLLPDQATFCLGSSHRICPRYQRLHGPPPAYPSAPLPQEEPVPGQEPATFPEGVQLDPALQEMLAQEPGPARLVGPWAWVAAFIAVFLFCSGSFALYAGWQLVSRGAIDISSRFQGAAGEAGAPPQEPIFILVTATPPPGAVDSPVATPPPTWTPTPTFAFPPAVTPTPPPIVVTPNDQPVVITTPTSGPGEPEPAPSLATAVSRPVIVATPTRRPTPSFPLAGTPEAPVVIVVTATPTEPLPTPVVSFRAAHQELPPGGCTILSWDVQNVRAVFFENQGVNGQGEARKCIEDKPVVFTLSVLLLDGSQQTYTARVDVVLPTATPTFTPTFTPVFTPTPTWTPAAPSTATPVAHRYGVTLAVDGGNQKSCGPGQRCEYVLQVTNTGDLPDEMFINMAHSNPTPAQLCRPDGICGETVVSIGIGPGDSLPIRLQVTIPEGASGQAFQYQLQAASGNSGQSVKSEISVVTVQVP